MPRGALLDDFTTAFDYGTFAEAVKFWYRHSEIVRLIL